MPVILKPITNYGYAAAFINHARKRRRYPQPIVTAVSERRPLLRLAFITYTGTRRVN